MNGHSTHATLLLTLQQPMSHHDPAMQDKSNRRSFNRQGILPQRRMATSAIPQAEVDAIAAAHPVPGDIAPELQSLSYPEFVGVALVRLFLDAYNGVNSGDGVGLLSGMQRYERLGNRVRQAAIPVTTLRGWWSQLADSMRAPVHATVHDRDIFGTLTVSDATQSATLGVLLSDAANIVGIARMWHDVAKAQSAAYAKKAGVEQSGESAVLQWNASLIETTGGDIEPIDIPTFQGNSARNQIVRVPGALHMMRTLGIDFGFPGEGCLPDAVEALFMNGGAIGSGVAEPGGSHGMTWRIRKAFPLVDLVGGCTNTFTLGESRLRIFTRLVCAENAPALADTPLAGLPNATLSAFEMLDEITQTHQASRAGIGQMISSCEVLREGVQIAVGFTLTPFTGELTAGALVAAIETFRSERMQIGGQKRVGFGTVSSEWINPIPDADELRSTYEAYLADNKEMLLGELMAGTLGAGVKVAA